VGYAIWAVLLGVLFWGSLSGMRREERMGPHPKPGSQRALPEEP